MVLPERLGNSRLRRTWVTSQSFDAYLPAPVVCILQGGHCGIGLGKQVHQSVRTLTCKAFRAICCVEQQGSP